MFYLHSQHDQNIIGIVSFLQFVGQGHAVGSSVCWSTTVWKTVSQLLLDGLPSSWWMLPTLVIPWLSLLCHQQVMFSLILWYIPTQCFAHSWLPDDKSWWFGWSPDFNSIATLRLTFVVFCWNVSKKLSDELMWSLVYTFKSSWIAIT